MTTPCPSDELLALHVDDGLPPAERRLVAAHLDQCEPCRRLLGALAVAQTCRSSRGSQIFPPTTWRWNAGTQLDRLVILGPLGRGGMGEVYEAHDLELDRVVAVKVTRVDGVAENERLLAEGRALAAFNHPHVNRVFDVGRHDGATYIVLERAPEQTLQHWLGRSDRGVRSVLAQFISLADACATLHEAGFVHRDIKPTNVLITADGQAVLADFGFAEASSTGRSGTPGYVAPEVEAGEPATAASDQYSFCVTLSQALGRCRGRIPRRVRAAWTKGMHHDPRQRFESMRALGRALEPPARRAALLILALPLLAFVPTGGSENDCAWSEAARPNVGQQAESWQRYQGAWENAAKRACDLHSSTAVQECLLTQRNDAEGLLQTGGSADPLVSNVWLTFEPEACLSANLAASDTSRRVRTLVERSHTAKLNGDMPIAVEAADEASELARQEGRPRDALLALRNAAHLARDLGELESSRARFEAAYWIAFQLDEPAQTADAALGIMNAFNLEFDTDGARPWHRNAEAALKRSPSPEHDRWLGLESGAAFMHQNAGELDASVKAAKRALGHARLAPASRNIGGTEIMVGETLSAAGDWRNARRYYEAGLESTRLEFGAESVSFGRSLGTFGSFCITTLHDYACAADYYRRSLDSVERHELRGVSVAMSYAQLATALIELGRVDEARPVAAKALELFAEYFPPDHPQQVWVHNLTAIVASATGSDDEARRLAEDGVRFSSSAFGPESPITASMITTLAEVLLHAGDSQAAKARFEEALEVMERLLGPDHHDLASIRMGHAEALEALGERAASEAIYRRLAELDLPESLDRQAREALARQATQL